MLELANISFMDSDVEGLSSQAQLQFYHQDDDVSAIAQFHVALDMTRSEFEAATISELIERAKPLIKAKLDRTVI